ncbi:MAG TPA: archaellin/type IV pilin N-terminal domain-containing protein [Candidatus Bathyarchaeia archaeon]
MKTLMRSIRKNTRGIVGIEAAIVMIAFVVIAAAMAYVVINMGFYSAQQAKGTIDKGIAEATSALTLDGFIVGMTNESAIKWLAIPVKLAVGQSEVDMKNDTVVIAVVGTDFALSNIYNGAVDTTTANLQTLMFEVNQTATSANATCYIFNDDGNSDSVIKQNEKAYIIIYLGSNTLPNYTKVKTEIRTSRGSALMVQRDIPGGLPTSDIVDLG